MTIDIGFWETIKGFMDPAEALALHDLSVKAAANGPILEIGSYCGKSSYVIGTACRQNDRVLFAVDHHMGSEEQQLGQAYFDPELLDDSTGCINTLPFFLKTLETAGLTRHVVPLVTDSRTAGKCWNTPLSMVFIDGGHSYDDAWGDYRTWAGHILPGGYLVFHDIFMNPAEGGQAPRQVYEKVLEDKRFVPLEMIKTLGILQRISP